MMMMMKIGYTFFGILRISKQDAKRNTFLSVFYLSMFRWGHHCCINRNHNNKNWTYLFKTYV